MVRGVLVVVNVVGAIPCVIPFAIVSVSVIVSVAQRRGSL